MYAGVFVNSFLILKRFEYPESYVHLAGLLMWLSFLVLRFTSLTLMIALMLSDALLYPTRSVLRIKLAFLFPCGVSFVLLYGMSCFWLYKMTIGIVKALRSSKVKPDEEGNEVRGGISGSEKEEEAKPFHDPPAPTKTPSYQTVKDGGCDVEMGVSCSSGKIKDRPLTGTDSVSGNGCSSDVLPSVKKPTLESSPSMGRPSAVYVDFAQVYTSGEGGCHVYYSYPAGAGAGGGKGCLFTQQPAKRLLVPTNSSTTTQRHKDDE
jgi:hypothetical protein